ncbi:MAG: HlyD family secretion protein [Planctomycetota bacterium]|jgi:HlyD family secretion protein
MNTKVKTWIKRALWAALLVLLLFGVKRALAPTVVMVDAVEVTRGDLELSLGDDGHTRVVERYTINAPVAGTLLRVALDAGAVVQADSTVLAEFEPLRSDPLDARSRAQAEAQLGMAEAAEVEALDHVATAKLDVEYTAVELARFEELIALEADSVVNLDRARFEHSRAVRVLEAARTHVRIAEFEIALAQALLESPDVSSESGLIALRSPIDGTVLRILEESARPLPAGTPLLEVGDLSALEIVADFLSQDAVQVRPGMAVEVTGWGGEPALLQGRVRLVEPSGFTKLSALGVEEQRVNIIIDPDGQPEAWGRLADGFRVDARILLELVSDITIVPTGALFRRGEDWAVYVSEAGLARERQVVIGVRNGLEAEVMSGLEPGESVILYPSELITDGAVVELR